jgi:hypothetical protein
VQGVKSSFIQRVSKGLLAQFQELGHIAQAAPDENTDVLLTSARFGEPMNWREALLFNARRRFNLDHTPTIFTLVHATADQFREKIDHLRRALANRPPDPEDFDFPGLAPQAHRVLIEQGQRGGPILALERLVQAQAKSIRTVLFVGDHEPEEAYLFDLVGAHPRVPFADPKSFYRDIALRIVTAVSTYEVTQHEVTGSPIPRAQWNQSSAPEAMRNAGLALGQRDFFTRMVRVADLVHVPTVEDAISSQYSEGCFATWDPKLNALIATVTGSARPVDKGNISEDDLAVIVGVKKDGSGALVRHIEGKQNDPPSSEAVELIDMDENLPRITLGPEWEPSPEVPVVRSKLHGHRGVSSYDPKHVEHVPLDPAYYHFPVSCATQAQARGIKSAFARSEALQDPDDPRQVIFTLLPGHGIVIAEKWVAGKAPFQIIWEAMDAGALEIENLVPQGPLTFKQDETGRMSLQTAD